MLTFRYESEFFQNVVNGQDIVSWAAVDRNRPNGRSDELVGFVTARIVLAKESEVSLWTLWACIIFTFGWIPNLFVQVFLSDSSFFVDVYALVFGIEWVMLGLVVNLLFYWNHWFGKHSSNIWDLVPGCLMWTIWIEQNRRSFEDEGKTVVQLLEYCQWTLFD